MCKHVELTSLSHAITIWGFTSQQNIHRVQRLQNRAARIITSNFDYVNVRGIDIVKQLKWMNITQRRDYFMALTMFKCINVISPIYMCNTITMCSDVANRVTRMSDASNMTVVPPASLEIFKNSFSYRGPIIWNTLPEHLRCCRTLNDFKKKMKIYVLG